jgi:hypothetical protein
LELVPYTVELVPKRSKLGTGACACSDAKFHRENKITYLTNGQSFRFQPLATLKLQPLRDVHTKKLKIEDRWFTGLYISVCTSNTPPGSPKKTTTAPARNTPLAKYGSFILHELYPHAELLNLIP